MTRDPKPETRNPSPTECNTLGYVYGGIRCGGGVSPVPAHGRAGAAGGGDTRVR